ncbi:MAG: MFS transporter, partial [Caulobacter sp.]
GMVVGPGLAGLLAPTNLSLPLYLTAALPAVALVVLWRMLPRVEHHAPPQAARLALSDARLRLPMFAAFLSMFSVAIAQIAVGFYALDQLGAEPAAAGKIAGVALAAVGVALVLAQVFLRALGWPPIRLIRVGAAIGAAGFAAVMLASSAPMLWACYAVAAFGMGWVFPSVSALAANAVEAHEQGATAGAVAAAQGLAIILGPLVGTAIYALDPRAPYGLMGALLLVIVVWGRPRPNRAGATA